jgi:hypothetical protein
VQLLAAGMPLEFTTKGKRGTPLCVAAAAANEAAALLLLKQAKNALTKADAREYVNIQTAGATALFRCAHSTLPCMPRLGICIGN